MPLSYRFVDGGRGTIWTGWGRLTGIELLDEVRDATARWETSVPFLYGLYDYSGVTEMEISTSDIHQLAAIGIAASKHRATGAVSVIYAPSDLPFGLARMWQAFADQPNWDISVFRDRPAAIAWLKERVTERFRFQATLE